MIINIAQYELIMNIGIDIDGVLYDWITPAYEYLVAKHGLIIPFEEFWLNETNIYSKKFWKELYKEKSLLDCYPPSLNLLKEIQLLGYKVNIFYVSSRPKEIEFATRCWLIKYGFPCADQVYLTKNKVNVIKKLGIDVFVEDQLHWIEKISKIIPVFIVDTFYNQTTTAIKNTKRIKSINQIMDYIPRR